MFKFLKDKLKSAISKISEGVEKEGKVEEKIVEKAIEEPKVQKGFFAKIKEKFVGKEEKPAEVKKETSEKKEFEEEKVYNTIEKEKLIEEKKKEATETKHVRYGLKKEDNQKTSWHNEIKKEEHKIKKSEEKSIHKAEFKEIPKSIQKEEVKEIIKKHEEPKRTDEVEKIIKEEPEKKGFFASLKEKIITTKINAQQFEGLFWELEIALMENNVAVEVIEKIKSDLKKVLVEKPIRRTKVEDTIQETLKVSIMSLFESNDFKLTEEIENKKEKPYVIAFFGINGSGKTTSIAKIANMLKEKNISCVLAAGDTFRAASIEQLQLHADKIGIKLIKHAYGSDPAAVAFDAIKHAKSKNIDAVLIDTAGRMHSNQNLIDEMKKIIRVAKPDLKIFVGESITGNDCVEQAKTFNESVGIDGIILAKADIDEKGGAAVSVSYVTKKPILYFGVGQEYKDLKPFDSKIIMRNLGFV
ncbi:MAG TPA: signal recognition particle-docking protein FtsY [Candidatus Nanoarchaeia archaeon]|nr:signal recognition particle-docking protein FtsY [Candidatus Nanoarchaeia archaeon]